jgi:hypothetical protein
MGKYDNSEAFSSVDFAAEAVPLTSEQEEIFDPLKSGLVWYKPPLASEVSQKTGGQEWCITGHDMQVLSMTVPPGETITTEVGSFMYMHAGMETKVELTLCSSGGCSEGCNRICGGESCVKVLLLSGTAEEGYVGLTPNFPAKVREQERSEFWSVLNWVNVQASQYRAICLFFSTVSMDDHSIKGNPH